jgi:hypothetical protein
MGLDSEVVRHYLHAAAANSTADVQGKAYEALAVHEAYAKLSLKKYRPIAARNEDAKVSIGLL